MQNDPVRLLRTALARSGGADGPASALLSALRRVVDVCDTGERVSRALLGDGPDPEPPTHRFAPMKTDTPSSPRNPQELDFSGLETARAELERDLPRFAGVSERLRELEGRRDRAASDIAALLRCLASMSGVPAGDGLSITADGLTSLSESAQQYFGLVEKAVKAVRQVEKLEEDDGDSAAESCRDRLSRQQGQAKKLRIAFDGTGFKSFDGVLADWKQFRSDSLAVRKDLLALPGARRVPGLADWGAEAAEAFPDAYRSLDTEAAQAAADELLRARAAAFAEQMAAIDAAQPPFGDVAPSSINLSGSFPREIVLGREKAFPEADVPAGLGIPEDIPFGVAFPFPSALVYGDPDRLQALLLRMAQALPLGLFEAYVLDSDNAGQTFREIAGLKRSDILSVSSKRQDDERILAELDTWLGDLADRGCWDDASDWADYNRRHPESPLPFKLVVFPSFAALDSVQMSVVAKLAKNGPTAGIVPVFSEEAILSLPERDGESAAKNLAELVDQFRYLGAPPDDGDAG